MNTILFELNEVPWRVVDWYCDLHPRSTLAKLRAEGKSFTSVNEDRGHLHPWVTWPTLHRGVTNRFHGIEHLGQNLKEIGTEFPAIWTLMANEGRTVGVAGSLQTYPVPREAKNYNFYIPDTYAPDARTIPDKLSSFQKINLQLTKDNSRNVVRRISPSMALRLGLGLPALGLSRATAANIGKQLLAELTDKTKLNRRRAIQSALYFDVFYKELRRTKPEFSTFFTNHVAASMHRFWAATFKDDYTMFNLPDDWTSAYADEIEWAMHLTDEFLSRLVQFCEISQNYRIIVASSMGQSATTAELREGLYTLRHLSKFFECLGVPETEIKPAGAMAPDVCVHLLTENAVQKVRSALPILRDSLGAVEIDIDRANMLHMLIVIQSDVEWPLPRVLLGNREYSIEELGFEFVPDQNRVACTAYHVPDGIVIAWEPGAAVAGGRRDAFPSTALTPAILRAHYVPVPDYMRSAGITL